MDISLYSKDIKYYICFYNFRKCYNFSCTSSSLHYFTLPRKYLNVKKQQHPNGEEKKNDLILLILNSNSLLAVNHCSARSFIQQVLAETFLYNFWIETTISEQLSLLALTWNRLTLFLHLLLNFHFLFHSGNAYQDCFSSGLLNEF